VGSKTWKIWIRRFVAVFTKTGGILAVWLWHSFQPSNEVESSPIRFRDPRLEPQIQKDLPDSWETYFGEPLVWTFLLNDDHYGRIAVVRTTGKLQKGPSEQNLNLIVPGDPVPQLYW
jgi:hypothetical protein